MIYYCNYFLYFVKIVLLYKKVDSASQPAFTYSKLTKETVEQGVKFVQS